MVSPSLLSANFIDLKSDVEMINKSEADWLHMDIMDGVFVPNISFGFPVLEAVAKVCTKPLDVHFMIVHPEQYMHSLTPYYPADSCCWYEGWRNPQSFYSCKCPGRYHLRCGYGAADERESRIRRTEVYRKHHQEGTSPTQAHQGERQPCTYRDRWWCTG